ncbi:hypothetical protein BpHYR1_014707 [Brachionus plicatilis]|uniref:Uncharacterized protein n=1 Tax=Brachionus plicatilis TaxID=10195 RepID=A0A3M7RFH2_BRAPC|nr:hypothetical protein BpHYR1_014707 [Brachionus plicatilis]
MQLKIKGTARVMNEINAKTIETEPATMSQIGIFGSIGHLSIFVAPITIIDIGNICFKQTDLDGRFRISFDQIIIYYFTFTAAFLKGYGSIKINWNNINSNTKA